MLDKMIREFRSHWRNYLFQSLLATFVMAGALFILSIQKNPVIVASIGATAFIVFAMPNDLTAKPRNVVGGHLVGILSGSVSLLILNLSHPVLCYSAAVGLSTS